MPLLRQKLNSPFPTNMNPIPIQRHPIKLLPVNERVILRSFIPGSSSNIKSILQRALILNEEEVIHQLKAVHLDFGDRHYDIDELLLTNYGKVRNIESFKERTPLQQNQQTQIKEKDLPIGTVKNKGGVDYIKKETGWEPVKK